MMRMTGPTAVALALAVTAAGLSAQQAPAAHSLAEGAWALQFRIAQDLTLAPFSGGVISAKHHSADDRALRYGLTFSAQQERFDNQPDRTQVMVGLVAEFLSYPTLSGDPGGNIHMFWGAGPSVSYQRMTVSPDASPSATQQLVLIGAVGSIGAEWFVRSRIGLTAEYQTGAELGFGTDRSVLRLAQRGVRFGASVYFGP